MSRLTRKSSFIYSTASVGKGMFSSKQLTTHSVTQTLLDAVICYALGWTLGMRSLIQQLPASLGEGHSNKLSWNM